MQALLDFLFLSNHRQIRNVKLSKGLEHFSFSSFGFFLANVVQLFIQTKVPVLFFVFCNLSRPTCAIDFNTFFFFGCICLDSWGVETIIS